MPGLPKVAETAGEKCPMIGENKKKLTMLSGKKNKKQPANCFILESQEQELKPQHLRVFLIFLQDAETTLLQVPMTNLM